MTARRMSDMVAAQSEDTFDEEHSAQHVTEHEKSIVACTLRPGDFVIGPKHATRAVASFRSAQSAFSSEDWRRDGSDKPRKLNFVERLVGRAKIKSDESGVRPTPTWAS